MAKVRGILKLSGTIGNITFRETKEGNIASQKSALTRKKMMNDPAFERSRYAAETFRKAFIYSRRLKTGIAPVLTGHSDHRVINRLTGFFMKILMQDTISHPADRRLDLSLLEQLEGFECNKYRKLSSILSVNPKVEHDRETRSLQILLEDLSTEEIKNPLGAEYITITSAVVGLDFEKEIPVYYKQQQQQFAIETPIEKNVQFTFNLIDNEPPVILVIFSVSFATIVAGKIYALEACEFNPACIIYVSER